MTRGESEFPAGMIHSAGTPLALTLRRAELSLPPPNQRSILAIMSWASIRSTTSGSIGLITQRENASSTRARQLGRRPDNGGDAGGAPGSATPANVDQADISSARRLARSSLAPFLADTSATRLPRAFAPLVFI